MSCHKHKGLVCGCLQSQAYALTNSQSLKDKLGGAIIVGRGESGGQSFTLSIIHNFFLSSGMICIPGEVNGVSATADKAGNILTQPKRKVHNVSVFIENLVVTAFQQPQSFKC